MKKRNILISVSLAGLIGFMLITLPAYADSEDFLVKAQMYYDRTCTKSSINKQKSTICYLFDRVGELGENVDELAVRVDELEATPSPSPSPSPSPTATPTPTPVPEPKNIKVFDASGTELGLLINRSPDDHRVFYPPLNRVFQVTNSGANGKIRPQFPVFFASTDCSSTAYRTMDINLFNRKVNEILAVGPGRYYIVDPDAPEMSVTYKSKLLWDGNTTINCLLTPVETTHEARELTQVTLPFSDPVPLPLGYRFE